MMNEQQQQQQLEMLEICKELAIQAINLDVRPLALLAHKDNKILLIGLLAEENIAVVLPLLEEFVQAMRRRVVATP